jgi:signal transduction histidine kinase
VLSRQATDLQRLIRQFLDHARLEAGRDLVVAPVATDVGAVVRETLRMMPHAERVEVSVDGEVPHALADAERLRQALTNLVSNALKFSPPDSPVSVRVSSSGECVVVDVVDRGVGIAPGDRERVFSKFSRTTSAVGTRGTGLGLYLSRAVTEAQGGTLTVESTLGEGSRFRIALGPADVATRTR